jgi:ribonuclease P protein component
MLPRAHRLHQQKDIIATIRQGKRLRTPYLLIHYRPHPLGPTRIACVVSRKIDVSAVKRHAFQRLMREVAKATVPLLTGKHDMVWVALPAITTITHPQDLQNSIEPYLNTIDR